MKKSFVVYLSIGFTALLVFSLFMGVVIVKNDLSEWTAPALFTGFGAAALLLLSAIYCINEGLVTYQAQKQRIRANRWPKCSGVVSKQYYKPRTVFDDFNGSEDSF
jgi:hypothetical protein